MDPKIDTPEASVIREPHSLQQRGIPTSYQHRFIMVVPEEWLDANPGYDWCRSSDVTDQVDASLRGHNCLHVLRTLWDRFDAESDTAKT